MESVYSLRYTIRYYRSDPIYVPLQVMEDGKVLEQVGRHKEKAATGEMEERSKHAIGMVID